MSKKFRGKSCGKLGVSEDGDHVIARAFFLDADRSNLPKVPACKACNNAKSKLETEVGASLLIGSKLPDGDKVRAMVGDRLAKNARVYRSLGLERPAQWVNMNGVLQKMHAITVSADAIKHLMELILRGLFFHEFGEPLAAGWYPEVSMLQPESEAQFWSSLRKFFPANSTSMKTDLGRGTFVYSGLRSASHPPLTVWQFAWHGGITLYGDNAPPNGASRWWGVTRPSSEALEIERRGNC